GGKAHGWAAPKRKIAAGKGVQYLFIFPRRLCEKGIWVARLLKVMIFGQLEPRDPKHRKTIKAAFWDYHIENREAFRDKVLRLLGLKPSQHLPFRHGQWLQERQKMCIPGSCCQDQTVGF